MKTLPVLLLAMFLPASCSKGHKYDINTKPQIRQLLVYSNSSNAPRLTTTFSDNRPVESRLYDKDGMVEAVERYYYSAGYLYLTERFNSEGVLEYRNFDEPSFLPGTNNAVPESTRILFLYRNSKEQFTTLGEVSLYNACGLTCDSGTQTGYRFNEYGQPVQKNISCNGRLSRSVLIEYL